MPRFTANSTALAAVLSMGIGLPVQAEVIVPADAVKATRAERASQMPGMEIRLQAETAAGLTEAQLSCLDGADRPCADDMPLITPAGIAVDLGESGEMILAPAGRQPYLIDKGQLSPRDGALKPLAEARLDEVRAAAVPAALAQKPKPPAATLEAAQGKDNQAKPAAEATPEARAEKPAAKLEAMPGKENPPKPAAEAKPDAAKPNDPAAALAEALGKAVAAKPAAGQPPAQAKADTQKLDELARQLEAAKAGAGKAMTAALAPAGKDSFAAQETRVTAARASQLQQERAAFMPELNAVLQAEIADGLTPDGLLCADGSARPCAEGLALVSPKGVAAHITDAGNIIMGRPADQKYVVGDGGKLRARGSNTAAAKEAAEAGAPTAAALAGAAAGKGEVVTETVTEAGARRSDQDFKTTIADAIAKASGARTEPQAAKKSDDDGGSDLAKLALAGLGALAVGQVLNGNREVALNTGDRVIVTRTDGSQQVLKDDNVLLRQPGNEVKTENYADGSSRTVVTRPDGSQIITIRGADLTVLRRVHIAPNGTETVLIDESVEVPPVQVAELPPAPKPAATPTTEAALREALAREAAVSRRFTLNQIRSIPEVRNLVAPVDINAITFDTGSAAINPDQARQLATLGTVLEDAVKANPREVFLIEGHTDAVGSATYNLALSDRRAESVALALSEYFDVPPENLVVQGYGEEYLKIPTLLGERENRRASVRRITDLLASAQ